MSLIERAYAASIFDPSSLTIKPNEGVDLTLSQLVTNISSILFYVVGLLAFIYLIYAGILYITANGNDEQAKKGQKGIINAVIGIIIVMLALTIVGVVKNLGAATPNI